MNADEFITTTQQALEEKGVVFFRVKISPNAHENKITEILEDEEHTVKIQIEAKPEHGKANTEIVKFLGKLFKAECQIISGNTGSVKLVRLQFEL
jgi:uncharacterized protein